MTKNTTLTHFWQRTRQGQAVIFYKEDSGLNNLNAGITAWMGMWFSFIAGYVGNTWINNNTFSVPAYISIFTVASLIFSYYIAELKPND